MDLSIQAPGGEMKHIIRQEFVLLQSKHFTSLR